jgi:hypothetical protein
MADASPAAAPASNVDPAAQAAGPQAPVGRLPTPAEVKALQASFDQLAASQGKPQTEQATPPAAGAENKPADGATPEHTAADALPSQPYELGLPAETPAAQILETQKATHALVTGLGFDADTARGSVQMIAKAQAARGAKPLDALEVNKLEFLLHERFGADYGAKMDRVQAALNRLGPGRGTQLQHIMNTVDPKTAAWMFETLSREQRA